MTGYQLSGYQKSFDGIYPGVNFLYRKGISDKSDFGMGLSATAQMPHIKFDFKRELWESNNKSNYLSAGIVYDIFSPSSDIFNTGFTIPLYLSLLENNRFSPYFTSQFSYGTCLNCLNWDLYGSASGYYYPKYSNYSFSAGMKVGLKRVKFFTEISYLNWMGEDYAKYSWQYDEKANYQITFGLIIGNKSK